MPKTLGWQRNRELWVRVLEKRTGLGVEAWNRKISAQGLQDEASLRAWLTAQGVTGYGQSLLVMERFGFPDFLLASPEALIEGQYADRPELRPILEAVIAATAEWAGVVVQARKTYVSLVAPHRTFARVQPSTRARVDLCLRLEREQPAGRLQLSKIGETMRLQVGLASRDEVDSEVRQWLQRAYLENC
jgi:hypothetical protein